MTNDANVWGELTAMLEATEVDLVLLEDTGGYERGLGAWAAEGKSLTPPHAV